MRYGQEGLDTAGCWADFDVDLRIQGNKGTITQTITSIGICGMWGEASVIGKTSTLDIQDVRDDGTTITFSLSVDPAEKFTMTRDSGHLTGRRYRHYQEGELMVNLEGTLDLVPAP